MKTREAEVHRARREYRIKKNEMEMRRRARDRERRTRSVAVTDEVVEEDAPEGEYIHNKRYTAEQEAAAVDALREGAKMRTLAKEMNVGYGTILYWKRKHGLSQSYTTEEKNRAVEALMKGEDPKKMAEETGISYSTLCRWRVEAGYQSPRAEAMKRKADERRERMDRAAARMEQDPPPKKPKPQADRLSRYCYLMDVVNYNRRKQGLSVIQYGEMQQHFDRYKPWMPEDWEKWVT